MSASESTDGLEAAARDAQARELAEQAPSASADLRDRLRLILRGLREPSERSADAA